MPYGGIITSFTSRSEWHNTRSSRCSPMTDSAIVRRGRRGVPESLRSTSETHTCHDDLERACGMTVDRKTVIVQAALSLGLAAGASPAMALTPPRQSVTSWRVVAKRNGVHLGIPSDSGQLVLSNMHSDAFTILNLPRANPEAVGWTSAAPPAQPYVTPETQYGDVRRPALPDDVAAVGWDGLRFVIAVNTPDALPVARMPYFLIRIEPWSSAMQTYAMPASARSEAVAIFVRGSSLIIADREGAEVAVPRS
jgi:hypothetical protein